MSAENLREQIARALAGADSPQHIASWGHVNAVLAVLGEVSVRDKADAWQEGKESAYGMTFGVSRGDVMSAVPVCHKRNCGCASASGDPDLIVRAVANAYRNAIRERLHNPYVTDWTEVEK